MAGKIRPVRLEDAAMITEIYNYYVSETVITFEEDPVSVMEMTNRIQTISENFPYIVYEEDGNVIGYAYANTWRTRKAYRFSCEPSVYLKKDCQGHGIGTELYKALLSLLKERGFHLVVGVVTLPNDRSVHLHEKLGFTKAGHFTQAGRKFERWLDVGFWELLLE